MDLTNLFLVVEVLVVVVALAVGLAVMRSKGNRASGKVVEDK